MNALKRKNFLNRTPIMQLLYIIIANKIKHHNNKKGLVKSTKDQLFKTAVFRMQKDVHQFTFLQIAIMKIFRVLKRLENNKSNISIKMQYRSKLRIFNRKISSVWETFKYMFKSQQGNVNQNVSVI